MKIHALNISLCILIIFSCVISSFSITEEISYNSFNIGHLMRTVVENIRAAQYLDETEVHLRKTALFENIPTKNFTSFNFSLFDDFNNVKNRCFRDLLYILRNLKPKDPENPWALKILDSYGKPESGILKGNFKWLGDFRECRNAYAPKNNFSDVGDFNGKYCSLKTSFDNNSIIVLTIGMCLPNSCDSSALESDFLDFLNILSNIPTLKKILSAANATSLSCKAQSRQLSNAGISVICVLSIFILLAVIGSFITIFKYIASIRRCKDSTCSSIAHENSIAINHDTEIEEDFDDVVLIREYSSSKFHDFIKNIDSFFNCFCIFTNGYKILNGVSTDEKLLSFHGIRFLSMSWVIIGHVYVFSFNSIRSLKEVVDFIDNWEFQVILNGFYSVDSFFLLSGCLLSYLYFEEAAKRNGKMNWLYFYVHRYLRLTPVYMMVVAFYTTLSSYLGSGPLWPDYDIEPTCQKYWWWNILYINNFLTSTKQCMAWSWYLANDMQFFVISPLILITLRRWPKIGYSIFFGLLLASWTSAFVITYHYNLPIGFGNIASESKDPEFLNRWMDYFDKIYVKPYTRIGPYLIGIALGHFLSSRKLSNLKISKIALCIGWAFATAVGLTLIYGTYHKTPTLVAASFYNALSRSAFGICLSWVIFVCFSSQGGPVEKILSYKLFIPLSHLTYCAYLIHPIVMIGYFGALKATFDFSHSTMVVLFLGIILFTYALSVIVSLIFESPIRRVEKFVRGIFES